MCLTLPATEYNACHEVEEQLLKGFGRKRRKKGRFGYRSSDARLRWELSSVRCAVIAKHICRMLVLRPVAVVVDAERCQKQTPPAFAFYMAPKTVVLSSTYAGLKTLLHELAHHAVHHSKDMRGRGDGTRFHGPDFCLALELVYDAYHAAFPKKPE